MATLDHLKDIDFRTKAERQKAYKEDFIEWYEDMLGHQHLHFSETVQAKLQMLSAVLWYLLPEKEYRKLTRRK